MIGSILTESLRTAVLVTGLVVIIMMLIEVFNVSSDGRMFNGLRNRRVGQVLLSALLGAVPGCMGGFASVSLYTHGLISFGALIAMMIASSGDGMDIPDPFCCSRIGGSGCGCFPQQI